MTKKTPEAEVEVDAPEALIDITRVPAVTLEVPIVGTSPLIMHRFSAKAKRAMLDAMQGRKTPKQPKDPDAEYESAIYHLKDGERYGFPVVAFKAATVNAARYYDKSVSMVGLRQFMFFHGELGDDGQQMAVIEGTPEMREDVVRVGSGTDLRYRPQFTEWSTVLTVRYVSTALTQDSVLSLIDAGGMGVGVGEWRPEKKGVNGCFTIDPTRPVVTTDAP